MKVEVKYENGDTIFVQGNRWESIIYQIFTENDDIICENIISITKIEE